MRVSQPKYWNVSEVCGFSFKRDISPECVGWQRESRLVLASPKAQELRLRWTRVLYDVSGTGDDILFVHGWAGTRLHWRNASSALPGFETIAPDLYGFGESEELGDEATIEDYVELLRALLTSLRVKHCVAVGHSMGGQIVARLAGEAKTAISGVVLIEAPVSDELRLIKSPVLLVFGDENSERTAIAQAQRSQNRLAEVVFIKNTSHNVMLDQPATFYRILGKFCESCFGSEDQ